ncbi:MAG TPA: YceI family protein [Acidobacteriota bacterium]|nr:YceI family protein [Acidobacteriota bacterium]
MVNRIVLAVTAVLAMASMSSAADWEVDRAHSSVNFEVGHLVISNTRGHFSDFTGTLALEPGAMEKGSVEFSVDVASVNTGDEARDKHLRSADFLDVENHATMKFKSGKVIMGEDGKFELVGDLTIRGVTKEVTFDCQLHGVIKDPGGKTRAGFSAATTINRQDFNVSWSKTLDAGGLVVGNDVDIAIETEFVQAD